MNEVRRNEAFKGLKAADAFNISNYVHFREPFLNKNFLEFVKYAATKNVYTATSSNAHYFTDEMAKATVQSGLDRLIISIDGTSQDTYGKYRIGGKIEKVIEGTQNLLKWKKELGVKTPHIIWQFIAFKHNEHQIPEIKKLAKEIGVDELGIKTAQIYDYQTSDEFIPENEKLSRYSKTDDGYKIKNKLFSKIRNRENVGRFCHSGRRRKGPWRFRRKCGGWRSGGGRRGWRRTGRGRTCCERRLTGWGG